MPDDGRQRIALHRDHHAGERYEGTFHGVQESLQVVTVDGQVASREGKRLEVLLVASVVVREVSSGGKSTRSEYTVEQCTTGGEAPEEVLPPGSVVVVTAVEGPGDGTITLVGGELTDDQRERIDLVVSTHISPIGDDDVFGSDEARAVGETWQVDSGIAARSLSKIESMQFAADHITGSTTFSSLEEVDGVPCQRLHAALQAEDFVITGLPEGSVTQSANVSMRMSASLPVDPSMPRLRSEERMTMRMVVQIPTEDGRTALMTADHRQFSTREIRPLAPE